MVTQCNQPARSVALLPCLGLWKHRPGAGIHRHVSPDRRLGVSEPALDHADPGAPPDGPTIRGPGRLSLRPGLSPVPADIPPPPRVQSLADNCGRDRKPQYPPACSESIVEPMGVSTTRPVNFIVSGCDKQLQSQTATVPEMFTRLPMNKGK